MRALAALLLMAGFATAVVLPNDADTPDEPALGSKHVVTKARGHSLEPAWRSLAASVIFDQLHGLARSSRCVGPLTLGPVPPAVEQTSPRLQT
jgi:hypothetical protein